MKLKTVILKISGLALASAITSSAMAYEPDTHFQMTYIICRTAGFTHDEALTVAAGDQGMDDSSGTVANGGPGGAIPNVKEEWLWHALDNGGHMGAVGVVARKDQLFRAAETAPGHPLLLLGVFFHYQGDTWAHRHHYDGNYHSYNAYTTYNTPFGHAPAGHQPDRPPFDPGCAIMNFEDGLKYAKAYLVDVLHRTPRAYVANYQPQGAGSIDPRWKPNGKYFHIASPEGPAWSARCFIVELVRAQISSYKSSTDVLYGFRDTADEADLTRTATNMQNVLNAFRPYIGEQITIPTTADKLSRGFTHLTTSQLISMGMPD